MTDKRCSRCGQTKTISAFYTDATRPTGFRSACKPCYNRFTYRRSKRRKFLTDMHLDTCGPFPKDLALTNLKRITEAWKMFRHGHVHSMHIAWKLENAYTANSKGLEFRRPTSDPTRVILDFHSPKGDLFHFTLHNTTPAKMADFISGFNVEIIYP